MPISPHENPRLRRKNMSRVRGERQWYDEAEKRHRHVMNCISKIGLVDQQGAAINVTDLAAPGVLNLIMTAPCR